MATGAISCPTAVGEAMRLGDQKNDQAPKTIALIRAQRGGDRHAERSST
jgi:hypothetical protein